MSTTKTPARKTDPIAKMMEEAKTSNATYHRLEKWLFRTFGKDLIGPYKKVGSVRFRVVDHNGLHRRLVGYEVMQKVEKWVERYAPEIKIISVDDDHHASAILLIIPHPNHGITTLFIPQCTDQQNTLFLYEGSLKALTKAFNELRPIAFPKKRK